MTLGWTSGDLRHVHVFYEIVSQGIVNANTQFEMGVDDADRRIRRDGADSPFPWPFD